jgi:hypothetical protein
VRDFAGSEMNGNVQMTRPSFVSGHIGSISLPESAGFFSENTDSPSWGFPCELEPCGVRVKNLPMVHYMPNVMHVKLPSFSDSDD